MQKAMTAAKTRSQKASDDPGRTRPKFGRESVDHDVAAPKLRVREIGEHADRGGDPHQFKIAVDRCVEQPAAEHAGDHKAGDRKCEDAAKHRHNGRQPIDEAGRSALVCGGLGQGGIQNKTLPVTIRRSLGRKARRDRRSQFLLRTDPVTIRRS